MRFSATASQSTPFIKAATEELVYPLLRRRLLWFAAAVVVISGALIGWALASLRSEALRSGERLTNSFAHVIAEQTIRTFQTIDQRLQMAATGLSRLDARGELNTLSAAELLRGEMKNLPFVRSLRVVEESGRVIYGSDEGGIGLDVADHAYFQIYRMDPEATFYVGPPVRSRSTGAWFISAAWPLRSATGAFEGVVVAAVEPGYFEKLWGAVDLGQGGSVALFRRDAVLLMRSPLDEAAMGKAFPELPTFAEWLPRSASGTFHSASLFDSTQRIFAYRTLPTHPEMVVVVGRSIDLVLLSWRQFKTLSIAVWGLAAFLVVGLAAFLNRSWHEREKTEARVEQMAQRLALATDAASIGVWDWNLKTDKWYATDTYFTMLGTKPENQHSLRKEWLERVHPDDRVESAAKMQAALDASDSPYQHETRLRHEDGSFRWMYIVGRVLAKDPAGKPNRLLGVMLDITESKRAEEALKAALRDKEALLKEVHHRVKNNLQVVGSLLRLEAGRTEEQAAKQILKDMQGRIQSMALLHETLYRSGNFASIDLRSYLGQLAHQLLRTLKTHQSSVQLELNMESIIVGIEQAIPCGLVLHELLSNCLKHAFRSQPTGTIWIALQHAPSGSEVTLRVSDSGPGLPQDFASRMGKSLGLQMVSDLARQLKGRVEVESAMGARFAVIFTVDELVHRKTLDIAALLRAGSPAAQEASSHRLAVVSGVEMVRAELVRNAAETE